MDRRLCTALVLVLLAACQSVAERPPAAFDYPIYRNGGKPDLVVDPRRFAERLAIAERDFAADGCALQEGAVGGAGRRRLLLFDTVIMNAGDGDLVVGDRADPNNLYAKLFEFAPCHGHFHIDDFSQYELVRADDQRPVVAARKLGFCFRDNQRYAGGPSKGYACAKQGITSGWADVYGSELDGQWIDITGIPEGDYIVRVSINASGSFDEGENRYPNAVQARIHIPDPRQPIPDRLSLLQ